MLFEFFATTLLFIFMASHLLQLCHQLQPEYQSLLSILQEKRCMELLLKLHPEFFGNDERTQTRHWRLVRLDQERRQIKHRRVGYGDTSSRDFTAPLLSACRERLPKNAHDDSVPQ